MIIPFAALISAVVQSASTAYQVYVPEHLQHLDVHVTLPVGTTRLLMDSVQAQQLPKGWATLIKEISAFDGDRPVSVMPAEGAAWTLPVGIQGSVRLTYKVDLGFTRAPWPPGNEQAGAAFVDALYIVGRPLFIVSGVGGASTVDFHTPPGWRVSTPWRSLRADGKSFAVANATELTRNSLVIGRHSAVFLRSGPVELELALPGYPPDVQQLVQPMLRRVLDAYVELFPGTPNTKYLMSFFPARADDGESFLGSAAFTATDTPTRESAIIWGNFLAHELMHFWNGQRIHGADPRSAWRWMAEGFTEYYANLTLAREGLIAADFFQKKAERHLGNYLYFATAPQQPRMTLVEAGTNTTVNRFGVYDGGWTAALCLDGLIRETSGDRKSLDDFMRAAWQRYGPGRPGYTVIALDSLVNEIAGSDLGNVVQRYVETRETLPIAQCLARLGLKVASKGYAAEAFLSPDPNATQAAVARRTALYGPRR